MVSYATKKNKVVLVLSSLRHDDKIDRVTEDQTFYYLTKDQVDIVDELWGSVA